MKLQQSITSREVNQNSGRVFRTVREEHAIIPVTYGSDSAPVAYIVPAEALADREAALEAVALATRPVLTRDGRSLRESFQPVPSRTRASRADQILEELRADRL